MLREWFYNIIAVITLANTKTPINRPTPTPDALLGRPSTILTSGIEPVGCVGSRVVIVAPDDADWDGVAPASRTSKVALNDHVSDEKGPGPQYVALAFDGSEEMV